MKLPLISPSILSADFGNLERDIKTLEQSGADMIHIDIMDGNFVPNITFGPLIVEVAKKYTNIPLDVHLMISNPDFFIKDFANAGANIITIHTESTIHLDRTLNLIKSTGAKAGASLVPSTSEICLDYIYELLDLILIMTVNPGFGNQTFLNHMLPKIASISKKMKPNTLLSVDGGINDKTAKQVLENGANTLVSGNFIFKNPKENIAKLKKVVETIL